MRTRKFLSTLIPALPMLLTALLVILVTVIFLTAMRSKAHAQFGGAEQPMFGQLQSTTFDPPTNNLVAWHKPETLVGTNNEGVFRWIDSTFYRHDATNGAGNILLLKNLLDGKDGVSFGSGGPGGGAHLSWITNAGGDMLRNVSGASFYCIVSFTNSADSDVFGLSAGLTESKQRLGFIHFATPITRFNALSVDANTASGGYASIAFNFPLNTFFLIDGYCNYTNRVHTAYTNGVQFVTHSDTYTAANTSDTTSTLARLGGGWTSPLRGYIVEFLLYNTDHSPETRRSIETNYFKVKYPSIPIN